MPAASTARYQTSVSPCARTVTELPCLQSPSPSLYSVAATAMPPSPGWPVNASVTGRLLHQLLAPLTLAQGMPSATKLAARVCSAVTAANL